MSFIHSKQTLMNQDTPRMKVEGGGWGGGKEGGGGVGGGREGQWWANVIKLVWTDIRIYLDAQQLTKQISEYIYMSKNWPNKIQIYLDAQELTKQIS